jgi:hypothetical protein
MSTISIMYGRRGPGAFSFSMYSGNLARNPEVEAVERDYNRYNHKKAYRVQKEIQRLAGEFAAAKGIHHRWFQSLGNAMGTALSRAFPLARYPAADTEVTNEDLEVGMEQITRYITEETKRFSGRHDDHWRSQHDTAAAMMAEWEPIKAAIEFDIAASGIMAAMEGRRSGSRSSSGSSSSGSSKRSSSKRSSSKRSSSKKKSSKGGRKRKTQRRR